MDSVSSISHFIRSIASEVGLKLLPAITLALLTPRLPTELTTPLNKKS